MERQQVKLAQAWVVLALFVATLCGASAAGSEPAEQLSRLEQQVIDAEQRFAASMAARDFTTFQFFLAEEAVFFSGASVLHGKDAVAREWGAYFEGGKPPFSWCPARVVVLASGTLAHSSGPVLSPEGECVATFNTIWRRRGEHRWEVVFDKGEPGCAAGSQCLEAQADRSP